MNNLRLLIRLLPATLCSIGVCAHAQTVVTLEDIFECAESNSAQLRPYITAVDQAEADIAVARSALMSDIGATLSLSYMGDGFTTKRNFSDYQRAPIPHFGNSLELTLNQPVYTGGAITAGVEMARHRSTASRFAADIQRDNIRFSLTGLYLDIYKYTNTLKVVNSNLEQARFVLADMTVRYEQGTALQNDITRYELLVSNLELQVIKINNLLEILNHNLVTVAGLPAGTVVVPDTTILQRSLPMQPEAWWLDEARANAPALSMARSQVDISRTAVRLARSSRLPHVGIQAGWNINGPILVEVPPINRNLSYWYVGVGISYDLSSLYKSNRTVASSRIAAYRASEELDAAGESIDMGIHGDYVRYLEAYEELKTQKKV